MSAGRLLSSLASLLLLAGCIAFVHDDPSKLHTTCTYDGDESACSKCVAVSCVQALDACCSDTLCSDEVLTVLGLCEAGLTCEISLAPDLDACVATSCTAECGTPPAVAVDAGTVGSTNCNVTGDSCFCEVGNANSTECNPSALRGPGLCCADFGWPNATDTTCSCQPFSCTPEGSDYYCSLGTNSTLDTTAGGTCCATTSLCICGPDEETSCETPVVSQCDVSAIGCGSSQIEVTSCSF